MQVFTEVRSDLSFYPNLIQRATSPTSYGMPPSPSRPSAAVRETGGGACRADPTAVQREGFVAVGTHSLKSPQIASTPPKCPQIPSNIFEARDYRGLPVASFALEVPKGGRRGGPASSNTPLGLCLRTNLRERRTQNTERSQNWSDDYMHL